MSKQKAQGTTLETKVAKWWQRMGHASRRLAEGGSLDEGDVEVHIYGTRFIVECKARQVLSVQTTLSKTRDKAGSDLVMLWWKRLVPSTGLSRRKSVGGIPEVIVLTPEALTVLLDISYQAGITDKENEDGRA